VHDFFATRILGPDRRQHLRHQLTHQQATGTDDRARRRTQLTSRIEELRRRQARLLEQLEDDSDEDLDPQTRRAFRTGIRDRFAELATQIQQAETERDTLHPTRTDTPPSAEDLLDQLPRLQLNLARAPEHLQRALYDACDLKIIYNREHHHATLKVTITTDNATNLADTLHATADRRDNPTSTPTPTAQPAEQPPPAVSHVLRAPGRAAKTRETPVCAGHGARLVVEAAVTLASNR
jgi:hypothetical protein